MDAHNRPMIHDGRVTIRICGIEILYPLAFEMAINATTAAAIGEQVMPSCDATEDTAQGLSGRIPFLSEISQIIGIRV